ncbi:hypothetical protein D083_3949 [Dickeya solani RNS 08.23.3.1.A]|nr:hypothetical protein D083_3949 [Dickeya solani RNS 08.23.3.1.A]
MCGIPARYRAAGALTAQIRKGFAGYRGPATRDEWGITPPRIYRA